jgi:hypothetical protein
MIHLEPPCIRARTGIEQRCRGSHKAVGSRAIETQVSGKAEVCERIPTARTTLRCCGGWITLDKPPNAFVVAEYRGRVHVAARDLRVLSQD